MMLERRPNQNDFIDNQISCEEQEQDQDRINIQHQIKYKTWKKNTPLLYDHIQTTSLLWPTLTVQWFPDVEEDYSNASNSAGNTPEKSISHVQQRLLLSSYSSGFNRLESVQLHSIRIPAVSTETLISNYDSLKNEFVQGIDNNITNPFKIQLMQRIPHRREINKARYMPQNPDLISTISNKGDVSIYDRTKKSNNFVDNEVMQNDSTPYNDNNETANDSVGSAGTKGSDEVELADVKLKFHRVEGWGLDWNTLKEAELVSGASDGMIAIWDLKQFAKSSNGSENDTNLDAALSNSLAKCKKVSILQPVTTYVAHDYGVNCVSFLPSHMSLIGSVGEDCKFKLFDTRVSISQQSDKGKLHGKIMDNPVNSLSFNKLNSFGFAVGDDSGTLQIHDLRFVKEPVKKIVNAHGSGGKNGAPITRLSWNHELGSLLLSAGGSSDGLVKIWDFSRPNNGDQLVFVHGGHMLGVNDVDWNPNDPKMVVSCSEDNSVQVWKPSSTIL